MLLRAVAAVCDRRSKKKTAAVTGRRYNIKWK
jgi:hypothetical protein